MLSPLLKSGVPIGVFRECQPGTPSARESRAGSSTLERGPGPGGSDRGAAGASARHRSLSWKVPAHPPPGGRPHACSTQSHGRGRKLKLWSQRRRRRLKRARVPDAWQARDAFQAPSS